MLAIKKRGVGCLILLALALSCGCAPPGPRALLRGQRLIREGKNEQAIESLQLATRLLPKNAQAYNHLGLAFHGNKQFAPARVSYQKALALDHKLAAAHYNLGCLELEQNDPAAAIEQLTSYTLLQPNSAEGWLKLGEAQLRTHKLEAAEKAFKTTLALHPREAEALNGLGVIQLQRKRPQEALNNFNASLTQNPHYGPALLNAGLVNQQYLNNRPLALEKYRQYLALQPRAPNWDVVSAMASRLDSELNPPPVHLAQVNPLPPPILRTNPTAAQTNVPTRPTSKYAPPVVATLPTRANSVIPLPGPPRMAAQTNQPNINPFLLASTKTLPAETPKPPPITNKAPEVKAPDIEVTHLPDELVVKPPQEISLVRAPTLPRPDASERAANPANPANPAPLLVDKAESKTDKRSLLSRLNPFSGKTKSAAKDRNPIPSPEVSKPTPIAVTASATNLILAASSVPPLPAFPRYTYLSPAKPASGNRREAERFFAEGIKAQQGGKLSQALAAYQKATQLDPAYFEAYYNQGLAAYGIGDWKESLSDYEHALAIKPISVDARYNFALALQQANYPRDAADELLEILNESPAETRAHLVLANLYARQLNQPKLARRHYLKVLEADSHHPKAAEIRYWLAANP